jgi:cyclophilin family peptidyl-prolyl cis-trans isomerase
LDFFVRLLAVSSVFGYLLVVAMRTRRSLLLPSAMLAAHLAAAPHSRALPPPQTFNTPRDRPLTAQRAFLDLRIITCFDAQVLEDCALRGRLVLSLYTEEAPAATARFEEFCLGTVGQFKTSADGPRYSSAGFDRLEPGVLLEGGKIAGLDQVPFAGALEYEYRSRLVPLRAPIETNALSHSRGGLLTRRRFNAGPEFGITLGSAPRLDSSHEVFGEVIEGMEYIEQIASLPYVTGSSREGPGTLADEVFQAQKRVFSQLAVAAGDRRAEDRTGRLLRRVEITRSGLL